MAGAATSHPARPRTPNFSRPKPWPQDSPPRPPRTVTFGSVHTIRAYYDSDDGRSDDGSEDPSSCHPRSRPRPSIDSAYDTSDTGSYATQSTDNVSDTTESSGLAPPKPAEHRRDLSPRVPMPPAPRPSAPRALSATAAVASPAIGPRLHVPYTVSARPPTRRASFPRLPPRSRSPASFSSDEQQGSAQRTMVLISGSGSVADGNNNNNNREEHGFDDARSHHTVSEAGGSFDGDGQWQSSSCDISGLSEKQVERLRRRGVNPALYLEMQAARKGRPKWLAALAGNTFLN